METNENNKGKRSYQHLSGQENIEHKNGNDPEYAKMPDEMDLTIGEMIRKLRKMQGMTQEQLSEGICSFSTISRIETGYFVPGKELLGKLLQRLKVKNRNYWFRCDEKTAFEEQLVENVFQMLEQENLVKDDRWLTAIEELKAAHGEKADHMMKLLDVIEMEDSNLLVQKFREESLLHEDFSYGQYRCDLLWKGLEEQAGRVLKDATEEEIAYHNYIERVCDRMLAESKKGVGANGDIDRMFICIKGVSLIRQGKAEEGEELFYALRKEIGQIRDLYRANDHRIAVCDINITIANMKLNRLDQAQDFLDHARRTLEKGSISWKIILRMQHVGIVLAIMQNDRGDSAYRLFQEARTLCLIRSGGNQLRAAEALQEEMSKRLLINVL